MAKPKTGRDPFEVRLSEADTHDLALRLRREILYAEQARHSIVGDNSDLDKFHEMYEGGNPSLTKNSPWEGAANLSSPLITEKVDTLRSKLSSTVFVDPIWIVEGFGDDAQRAPFIEAYHQWKAEQEKLQQICNRAFHNSLIEGTGVIEVTDRTVIRKQRMRVRAQVMADPMGRVILGPEGEIQPIRDPDGNLIPADDPMMPSGVFLVDEAVRQTAGPSYRVLGLQDFFLLPGHAAEKSDLWGYAKRVYRRLPDLERAQKDGFYRHVDQLTKAGDREPTEREQRAGQDIAPQYDKTAEKEIWEVTFLDDLDKDGFEEWYVATLSIRHDVLLRLQYQDYNSPNYVLFVPFPRSDSVYGYSFAWQKLGTLYQEHTAIRNMIMDRSNLVTNAPFLVTAGSPWNSSRVPFGPRQKIPVRDINEVQQLKINDVPASLIERERAVLSFAERVSGLNDVSMGVNPQQDRTFSEVRLVTQQSFVRIDEAVRNMQEGMEDLFDVRHMIYVHRLEGEPEKMPSALMKSMQERGFEVDGDVITPELLDGDFHGKPRGSVENADIDRMRADFVALMTAITQMVQAIPPLGFHFSQPKVVRSFLLQMARTYRWFDPKGLLEGLDQNMMMVQQMQQQAQLAGGPGLPFPGNPGRSVAGPPRPQPGPVNA